MTDPRDELQRIRQVYARHYPPENSAVDSLWHPLNPVSIYYRQSQERAIAGLFRRRPELNRSQAILDLGCGTGGFMRLLVSLHIPPERITGIDLLFPRLGKAARSSPPGLALVNANAAELPFQPAQFDLVSQFTVFSSILDPGLQQEVARSIDRVLRPGGYVLWYDLAGRGNERVRGLGLHQVRALFPGCRIEYHEGLHPPLATRLARRSILLCNLLEKLPGLPRTHLFLLLKKL